MKNFTRISILFAAIILSTAAQAQLARLLAGNELNGDKHFESYAFADALEYYLRAYENDSTHVNLAGKIAECYRRLNSSKYSEIWYRKLIRRSQNEGVELDPLAMFHYAESLKGNRKYDLASVWLKKYAEVAGEDQRIDKKLDAIKNQSVIMDDAEYIEISELWFNVPEADFSPFFYEDGIAFVSARKNRAINTEYAWDNTNFLDVFVVDPKDPESVPVGINGRINSKLHDGPICFYNNETKAAFTRNSYDNGRQKRSKDGTNNLQLFFADTVDGKWGNIQPFEYNSPEYSTGHPTVRQDGNLLIFASDRPGGFGNSDLYYCYWTAEGWSEPINMGSDINTEGNELFPFVEHKVLYFTSDGHGGLGGLDIFYLNMGHPETLRNVGFPINTNQDDFALVRRGNEGYFTSNRGGDDDIFHFVDNRPRNIMLSGVVKNQHTDEVIPGATVYVGDEYELTADEEGKWELEVEAGKEFELTSSVENMLLVNPVIAAPKPEEDNSYTLWLKPVIAKVVVVDKESRAIIPGALIKLKSNMSEDIKPKKLDEQAAYYEISGNTTYNLSGASEGYFTTGRVEETKELTTDSVYWEIPLELIVLNKEIELDNIYYDLNKATIRSDAEVELNKLVKLLLDNSTIKIELSSHTDARGSSTYNQNLSQQRAESVVKYLTKNGISSDRMEAKGYGESKLKNDCKDGTECSEDDHQANRRTEFKVTEY